MICPVSNMDTTLHLIIIISCMFQLLLHFFTTAEAQSKFAVWCNNRPAAANLSSNNSDDSVYDHNLKQTLRSLSVNASVTGFATAITRQDDSVVYGLIQCMPYVTRDECQACARNSTLQITHHCPNYKQASIICYSCALRYSDKNFFSSSHPTFPAAWYNPVNVSNNPDGFNDVLGNLLKNISATAASSPSRVSLQRVAYTKYTDLYAMVQCVPTLDVGGCSACLEQIVGLNYIPTLCRPGTSGCRIISSTCNLRYELYSFALVYNSLPSSPPLMIGPDSTTNTTANSATGKKSVKTVIAVAASSAAAVVMVIICLLFGCLLRRKYTKKEAEGDGDSKTSSKRRDSLMIGLSTLKTATNNFSDMYKLGKGGFGSVYKGRLLDGQEIAVKRLARNSGQGLEELRTEVILVARLLHQNLVKLVGFCLEKEEKLLVYEYLINGSLDKILFSNRRLSLEWKTRFKIIVGIARGLLYLHEDSQLQIIYRDLKASNILLDEHMNPKISDFGLARLFCGSQTQGNTIRIAGTYGYMAPEYARHGHFSTKSDVYSFGILVLEIVTGRKNLSFPSSMNLQSHTWQHWANGTALEVVDPTMREEWPRNQVLKCIQMGLMCVQDGAADRPAMSEVMMMLISSSSYTTTSPSPGRPAFCSLPQPPETTTVSPQLSINDFTITKVIPR